MRKLTDYQAHQLAQLQKAARVPKGEGSPRWRVFGFMHRLECFYPDTPEGRLWKEVLRQAAEDAAQFTPGRLNSFLAADGRQYLLKDYISAAEAVGLPSDYVTRVAKDTGVVCG